MRKLCAIGLLLLGACDSPRPPAPSAAPSLAPSSTPVAKADPTPAPSARPSATPAPEATPTPRPLFPLNELWKVPPLEDAPLMPDPSDEAELKQRGWVRFPGGYVFELPASGARPATSGVVAAGTILMNRGLIELMGCGEGGKEHESILRIETDIQALDLGLVLSGLKRGPVPPALGDPSRPQGQRVVVLLQWIDGETSKAVTHRAEDGVLFHHPRTDKNGPMPRIGWTYVGQMMPVADATTGNKRTFKVLAATGSRSLLTTFRDPSTLLDNPMPEAMDDTLFAANYMVLPPPGTRVRVVVRAPTPAESAELLKAEQELLK